MLAKQGAVNLEENIIPVQCVPVQANLAFISWMKVSVLFESLLQQLITQRVQSSNQRNTKTIDF